MPRDLLAEKTKPGPRDLLAVKSAQPEVSTAPKSQPATGGYGTQAFSGLLEGATGALGAPVDFANNLLIAPAMKGVNALFGTDFQPSAEPLGGSAGLRKGLAIAPESGDAGPQMARRVSQSVGGGLVPLSTAKTVGQLAAGVGTAIGGGAGGAVAQQAFPGNAGAEIAAELLGGLGAGSLINGAVNRSANRAAQASVPTVDQLKSKASDLYDLAEKQGITASQQQTQALASDFRQMARTEGLVSPTGRVSEAYPRAAEAMRVMDDYATGAMNPTQMQTVRDVLSDAVSATMGKERRIASIMLDKFDGFTAPLSPHLAEARDIYSRAAKGKDLETLSELAGSRAGQFTGSGYENALRTEYRGLERKIIKGQERGWSPDQQDAISRVAQGTRGSNTFRNIGKAAPMGPVSFMSSAGLPAIAGTLMGGPMVGAALATGTSLGGYGARAIATNMGLRNAEIASLLARNGGVLPTGAPYSDVTRKIAEALIGAQAAAQSNLER